MPVCLLLCFSALFVPIKLSNQNGFEVEFYLAVLGLQESKIPLL
jgi:hypothetical protein